MEFNIYPNISVTKKIVKGRITRLDLTLFESIKIDVILLDEDEKPYKLLQLEMDKTNGYLQYGTDDKYLIDWVKSKIIA